MFPYNLLLTLFLFLFSSVVCTPWLSIWLLDFTEQHGEVWITSLNFDPAQSSFCRYFGFLSWGWCRVWLQILCELALNQLVKTVMLVWMMHLCCGSNFNFLWFYTLCHAVPHAKTKESKIWTEDINETKCTHNLCFKFLLNLLFWFNCKDLWVYWFWWGILCKINGCECWKP